MQFRIAHTFSDSLARLPAQEQKAAKTTAFDLQLDPATPGMPHQDWEISMYETRSEPCTRLTSR